MQLGVLFLSIDVNNLNNTIDISSLNAGHYNLFIESDSKRLLKRIIVSE